MTTTKKITLATIKAFVRKNREKLLIKVTSQFDGQIDGCRETGDDSFDPICQADNYDSHNLGIQGAWFVLGGRDWFEALKAPGYVGFRISNCCRTFYLAIRAE